MRSAFISYSRADLDKATELSGDIIGLGHEVWMDRELSGGMLWWEQILNRIRESDVFIYLASPSSLESQACLREMKYATALKKPVLPILIAEQVQPDSLPTAIQEFQLLNYAAPDKAALFSLARALKDLPQSPPLPDPLPSPPMMPSSYISELREDVDSDEPLSFDAQTSLLIKLREQLKLRDKSTVVREVLQRFRRRRDLFAIVAEEIDAMERPALKNDNSTVLGASVPGSDLRSFQPAVVEGHVSQTPTADSRPLVSAQHTQSTPRPARLSLITRIGIFGGLTGFLVVIAIPLLLPFIWRVVNGTEPPRVDNFELGVVVWLLLLSIEIFRSLGVFLLDAYNRNIKLTQIER